VATTPTRRPAATTVSTPLGEPAPPPTRGSGETAVIQAAPATAPASGDDMTGRMRGDWEAMKDGFRHAGRDIRSGFADLGRQIKRVFD
jgi:hypothetical protein